MKSFFLVKWLNNISITRKLYFTVGIMATLIAIELVTLIFAVNTLSAVRACVGAEGLWSKAQKNAVYSLQRYGRTHDEADYKKFQEFLKVPLGDRTARIEMQKKNTDLNVARQGFLEGRLHPDDIDGAISLFSRFKNNSYIGDAIGVWTKADTLIAQLVVVGREIHEEVARVAPSQERINQILLEVGPANDGLTQLEDEFSATLEEGSRFLAGLILKLLLGIVLTVEICGLTLTILISRGIVRGLKGIIVSAEKVAAGNMKSRAKVFSNDEIGILANSFNDMTAKLEQHIVALRESEEQLKVSKEEAEQSVVVKENFLANMSHEIRTPMNAVIGFTTLLENSNLDEQQQQFVQAIKISGQNLMTIINDILDYSKIESGMVIIEETPFNIRNIFESLNLLVKRKAEEKKLQLEYNTGSNIPASLIGDPTRLIQILLNLTDNAIKFTEKGTVTVTANLKQETADTATIEFEVRDTGRGIPADKQSAVFERFIQASSKTTRLHGGTGLGLSIVKSLVELQHGTIVLKSEVGKGSAFTFTISYKKGSEQQPAPQPSETSKPMNDSERAHPLQILLAEDNKMNQSLVKYVLGKYGIETDVAGDGETATDKMRLKKYDLVLMDIQMPLMDGYEATKIIREELHSNVPIIALTAHAMNDEKERCFNLGMNDYISKPFDPAELYQKISALCPA